MNYMLGIFQKFITQLKQLFGQKEQLISPATFQEYKEGQRKFRYKIIEKQAVYQRNTEDQLNAIIVMPDFEPGQHDELLQKSLQQLGSEYNIDSFSVYQNDDAVAFSSQVDNLSNEEEQTFRDSFIGVYPGRRR